MLTAIYNPRLPDDAELARVEVWLEAESGGFAVSLVAVLIGGARLLIGTAAGCDDEPVAMDAAERLLRNCRLGQSFVNYCWGRPAIVPVEVDPGSVPVRRQVA